MQSDGKQGREEQVGRDFHEEWECGNETSRHFSTLEMVMVRVVDDDVDNNDDDKSLVPSGEPQPERYLVAHKADRGDEPTGPTGFCRF